MGDLVDLKKDPIFMRKARLKDLLSGKRRRLESEINPPSGLSFDQNELGSELLLDAFALLYDECTSGGREPKEPHMKYFVNKCKNIKRSLILTDAGLLRSARNTN